MDVHCGCTRFSRGQTFVGNLRGRDGQVRGLVWRGDVACDGARKKSFLAHIKFVFFS
jgi:hypothetical protein